MFKFLFGVTSSLFKGLYWLLLPLLIFRFLSKPRESFHRRLLRFSYHLYAGILNWINPYFKACFEVDLLEGFPRILAAIALSLGSGYGLLSLLHLRCRLWMAMLLLMHGWFVGKQWERIEAPRDFQMGVRLDE